MPPPNVVDLVADLKTAQRLTSAAPSGVHAIMRLAAASQIR